ncbi:MAG: hypothetical protein UU24_C0013G0006 [Candidatus Nomurabacteria bacterium GW2011_GWA2_40_9]|uniref:Uncharacterized protein n=1 Tax=Candidatus Nomurabacteria bacterium GW2011_GWA2_40_9 TaxID=1618734 RepID=A0A0G0TQK2_9BACT|nr:MAG: hypothetical protein UU24_C0013G0006 [Candidatus Nomurabacteria bacterium GW2011_GWA2_40_9]
MQNKIIKKNIKKSAGFTLVETLVAIMIFTASVLALMVVLSNSLSNANFTKRKLTATFLAQEGVEYMRNMRDTYVLYLPPSPPSGYNGWDNFIVKISECNKVLGKSCYFDNTTINFADQTQPIIDMPIFLCPSQICPELKYIAGEYNYDVSGINSGFVRKMEISKVANSVGDDEIEIISTVYYTTPSGLKNISLKENLFNWIQ